MNTISDYMPRLSVRFAGAALMLICAGAVAMTVPALADPSAPRSSATQQSQPQTVRFTLVTERLSASMACENIGKKTAPVKWSPCVAGTRIGAGTTIRYTVRIENCGPKPVGGVVVTRPIPSGTTYILSTAEASVPIAAVSYLAGTGQYCERPTMLLADNSAAALQHDPANSAGMTLQPAPAEAYRQVRWIFNKALPPRSIAQLTYQVSVQ